jgi:hypothetical protein
MASPELMIYSTAFTDRPVRSQCGYLGKQLEQVQRSFAVVQLFCSLAVRYRCDIGLLVGTRPKKSEQGVEGRARQVNCFRKVVMCVHKR